MNATSARQNPIGATATSMNGRRRPSGVWKVSDHGPITGESARANRPSEPSTSAISVPESVKRPSRTCRYVVVVSANARPNAPSPSDHVRPRWNAGASARWSVVPVGGEARADHLHDRVDRARDVLGLAGEAAEHPSREDLLQRAVEHPRHEPRVGVGADLAGRTLHEPRYLATMPRTCSSTGRPEPSSLVTSASRRPHVSLKIVS